MTDQLAASLKSSNPKDLIGFRKPPIALCPPTLWLYASLAMKLGAKKYGPYNWRKESVSSMTYINALLRHTLSFLDGEENDSESKCPHLAHAAACIGILLDAKANNRLIDDRPEKGRFAELVTLFTEQAPDSLSPQAYLELICQKTQEETAAQKKVESDIPF